MKKLILLILICILVSSCETINSLYDGTNITYNAKKGTFSAKTKINKHFTIKY